MTIRVEVVHALPEEQHVLPLELDDHASVADALDVAGSDLVFSRFVPAGLTIAIWGNVVERSHPLRDGDRIELLRPLLVDPKEARRRRVKDAPKATRR